MRAAKQKPCQVLGKIGAATMDPALQLVKIHGHQGQVTCLDHSSSLANEAISVQHACLLSGSADGTAQLWDLRNHLRAAACIKMPLLEGGANEVLSVSFGRIFQPDSARTEESPSTFIRDYTVYVSAGSIVYEYDLRKATSPTISLSECDQIFIAEDDVNSISRSSIRHDRHRRCIAFADDAGRVTVSEEGDTQSTTTLTHNEQALVTSAVFRPNYQRALQIASGGTDCRIILWDTAKPRQPMDQACVQTLSTEAHHVCNPPMINSLAWSPSGKLLAAALGDGSCALYVITANHSLTLAARLEDIHSGPVASVLFPQWTRPISLQPNGYIDISAHDRLFCSIGNEGKIILWDLGSSLCGDEATNPTNLFPSLAQSPGNGRDDEYDFLGQPKSLFTWQHVGGKPNWMVSSCGRDAAYPSALFVADTSNDITIYNVPL